MGGFLKKGRMTGFGRSAVAFDGLDERSPAGTILKKRKSSLTLEGVLHVDLNPFRVVAQSIGSKSALVVGVRPPAPPPGGLDFSMFRSA
jgi:hypothetical protein